MPNKMKIAAGITSLCMLAGCMTENAQRATGPAAISQDPVPNSAPNDSVSKTASASITFMTDDFAAPAPTSLVMDRGSSVFNISISDSCGRDTVKFKIWSRGGKDTAIVAAARAAGGTFQAREPIADSTSLVGLRMDAVDTVICAYKNVEDTVMVSVFPALEPLGRAYGTFSPIRKDNVWTYEVSDSISVPDQHQSWNYVRKIRVDSVQRFGDSLSYRLAISDSGKTCLDFAKSCDHLVLYDSTFKLVGKVKVDSPGVWIQGPAVNAVLLFKFNMFAQNVIWKKSYLNYSVQYDSLIIKGDSVLIKSVSGDNDFGDSMQNQDYRTGVYLEDVGLVEESDGWFSIGYYGKQHYRLLKFEPGSQ